MCFVFLPAPSLLAMLLPLESACILMFALLSSKSVGKFWKCNASIDPVLMAKSSASALDKAIAVCVLLP